MSGIVREHLIIHVYGESRRKHGSFLKIIALKENIFFPIEERRCLYKTWPHQGFHLMCYNYFVDRFSKRKIEGKRGPLLLQGSREKDTFIFYLARNDFNGGLSL